MSGTGKTLVFFNPESDIYLKGLVLDKRWYLETYTPADTITFSFPASASLYGSGAAEESGTFTEFSTTQKNAVRSQLAFLENLVNIDFVEMTETVSDHAMLRYGISSTASGYANTYIPTGNNQASAGDVWLSTGSFTNPKPGNFDWYGLMYETGHALCLRYGHISYGSYAALPAGENTEIPPPSPYYQSTVNPNAGFDPSEGYPSVPSMYTIYALRAMYGTRASSANTLSKFNPTTAVITIDGVDQPDQASNNDLYYTIYDSGVTDTIDLSDYTANFVVDLRSGHFSTVSSAQLANTYQSESALGNFAIGVGDIIENVILGSGTNSVRVNSSNNVITGGGGTDTIVFSGNFADYNFNKNGTTIVLGDARSSPTDGLTTCIGSTTLQFADQSKAISSLTGVVTKVKWAS